ncbi:MAG: hypothetical protein ACKOOH_10435 [Cyanobium sp.]
MGLFDRLLGNRDAAKGSGTNPSRDGVKVAGSAAEANPKKSDNTFFLDADASSTLGDVNFMRRSNTIRRTFPGTADSPGNKEMVAEVASMEARLERMSEGLAGKTTTEETVDLTGGIPKPVKKTFAQTMSAAELEQRKKGSAMGVNVPGGSTGIGKPKEQEPSAQPQINQPARGKAGAIDPFKQMVRDLNN